MEYRTIDEIRHDATVTPSAPQEMSRRQRLERWAAVIDHCQHRHLTALPRLELRPRRERAQMRADYSPLSVAYNDPILRAEGLRSDLLGDAMSFFELSGSEAHYLLCDCYYGSAIAADILATRLRWLATQLRLRDVWAKIRNALGWD